MKASYKLLAIWLLLSLLLAACGPAASDATPSPEPTVPPPATGAIPLPSNDTDDPLDAWRERRLFRDARAVPWKANNLPVLVVENLELDWDAFRDSAFSDFSRGVPIDEYIKYFRDSDYPDKHLYGNRHYERVLQSENYPASRGDEITVVGEQVIGGQYWYFKKFRDPASTGGQGDMRYSREEAIDLVIRALSDWGVPLEELEMNLVSAGDSMQDIVEHYYGHLHLKSVSDSEPHYMIYFRHVLYDIPVYNLQYLHRLDQESPENSVIPFYGDYVYAQVSDLGLRSVGIRLHRITEVDTTTCRSIRSIASSRIISNGLVCSGASTA